MESDIGTLQTIGIDLVHSFTGVVVETFLLAIYTVSVFQTCRVLVTKGFSRGAIIMLTVLLVMFSMALVMWGFDITNFIREVQITLIRDPDLPMATKWATSQKKAFGLLAPLDLLYAYMALLGDSIVVWRVFILWGSTKRKWVVALPFALLVGSFVASILLTFCVVRLGTKIIDGSFQSPAFCKNVQTATYCMPTATTAFATILIGWKTWEYRRSSRHLANFTSSLSESSSRRVERVLILLVESGVLYFLFFLIIVIGSIPGIENNAGLSFAFFVYSYSTSVVVGLYPTLVILLSHSEYTSNASTQRSNSIDTFKHGGQAVRVLRHTTEDVELSTFSTSAVDDQGLPSKSKVGLDL